MLSYIRPSLLLLSLANARTMSTASIKHILSPTVSFETVKGRFEISTTDDRESVCDFMRTQFLDGCARFSPESVPDSFGLFPTIFSELVPSDEGDKLWSSTKVWKCCPADDSSKIVGALGITEEIDKQDGIPFIYISFWFVDSSYADIRIGGSLWRAMPNFVETELWLTHSPPKYRKLKLITSTDLYAKAYQFYLRDGFKELPCEYSSPYWTLVRMEKQVP